MSGIYFFSSNQRSQTGSDPKLADASSMSNLDAERERQERKGFLNNSKSGFFQVTKIGGNFKNGLLEKLMALPLLSQIEQEKKVIFK